jgi:hypothetical protein
MTKPFAIPGMTTSQWQAKLTELSKHLKHPTQLCIIGSFVGMSLGQPDRRTIDIDILRARSKYLTDDLRQAAEKVGLMFNPKAEFLGEGQPYLQLVDEGLTQLGEFEKALPMERYENLELVRPPLENVIAAKLIRSSSRDVDDITFLYAQTRDKTAILEIIRGFPRVQREQATENSIYLEVVSGPSSPSHGPEL